MKKRIISALLTVLMVMSLFTGLSVSAYADDENPQVVEYTLKAGDYVLKLCQAQGINYFTCKDAIIKLNGLKSENDFRFLAVGRVIKLPATDAAALNIIASGSTGTGTGSTGSTGTTTGTVSAAKGSDSVAYYLIPYTIQRGETVAGICNSLGISFTQVTRDTNIIAQVLAGESTVTSVFTADQLNTITEFGQHMDFFGIDLTRVPQYSLAADNLPLLIFPILAVVTMFISTHISMKASGQEMQGSMKLTMYMMPLMYVFFCFTVPCAFSLYYVISNIVMTVQTQVMRKIYDPEKMKEQVKAEIASRKKEEKRGVKSTTIKVKDEKTGEVVEKNISASEMNKRRLEYARQQDAERYKDERTVPLSELQNKKED